MTYNQNAEELISALRHAKQFPKPSGVYSVDGGWKHSQNSETTWPDKTSAETDYRFSLEHLHCVLGE